MMIELICDHKIQESPLNSNRSGIHHVAWIAPDFEKEKILLESNNCVEVLSANSGHRDGMKFAWFDPQNEMNHFYEIYEDTDDIRNFYSFLYEESKIWDGHNPVKKCQRYWCSNLINLYIANKKYLSNIFFMFN